MKRRIGVAVVAVWVVGALAVGTGWGQGLSAEQARAVSTTGEAVVNVVPDEVVVQFGVQTFGKSLDEAKDGNEQAARRLVEAVKTSGLVEENHLRTEALQLEIEYENGGPKNGIAGYMAKHGYSVTLKKPAELEALVDLVLRNGANVLMGVEFRTTDLRKHRDAARLMAVRAAKEKAEALAAELGCRVGPPRAISEQAGYSGYWGFNWGWRGGYQMAQNVMQNIGGAGSTDGGEALPLGQVGVRGQVSVSFDLIPADGGERPKPEQGEAKQGAKG